MASRREHAARPNRESLKKRLGKLARRIAARDGHCCVYCGATAASSGAHLHLDHLLPRALGGADTADNLVVACRSCNSSRQDTRLAPWCRSIGLDPRAVRRQARRVLPEIQIRRAA